MGGDGGVIATKRAFSRGVGKNSGQDHKSGVRSVTEEQFARATTCALTNQRLVTPIVCCELGNLFNKEAILSAMVEEKLPEEYAHIRSLKDIKTLTVTNNPKYSELDVSSTSNDVALFICPVTKDEFNGSSPFFAIWSTGHILSDKAIKELGTESLQEEYGPFTAMDMVKLLPLEQDMDQQRAHMHKRRELMQSSKKKKDKKTRTHDNAIEANTTNESKDSSESSTKKVKKGDGVSHNLSTTASLVSTVNQSVADMEQKSDVYKSLFHKGGEKDKKDRDLFMSVAGIRYTL